MEESSKKLGVQSVHRNTLSQQVVDQIVHLLVTGQMKAGDKLPPEMELMKELEVSRPVLREALSALDTLGVITRKTREGTFLTIKSVHIHSLSCWRWLRIIYQRSSKREWHWSWDW